TFGMGNIPSIGSERTYPERLPERSLWGRLRRWSYSRLTAIVALTHDTKAWLESNTGARQLAVIPNAIEWPLPIQAPILAPENIVFDGKRVLLAVGRLEAVKGFDSLIDAFSPLVAKHPDWILVILGEGSQRTALEAQISERGMNGKILLPGTAGNIT